MHILGLFSFFVYFCPISGAFSAFAGGIFLHFGPVNIIGGYIWTNFHFFPLGGLAKKIFTFSRPWLLRGGWGLAICQGLLSFFMA